MSESTPHCPKGPDRCRICALTDRGSPHYRADYRRLFHPEEFPDAPPPPPPALTRVPAPIAPDIPLAGDVIAAIAQRIGADRLAKLWERWTGVPCGCARRRDAINRASERLVKWLARRGGGG